MSSQDKKPKGCGCSNIPISLIILILGGGYWLFTQRDNLGLSRILPNNKQINIPFLTSKPTASPTPSLTLTLTASQTPSLTLTSPTPSISSTKKPQPTSIQTSPTPQNTPSSVIEKKTNTKKVQNRIIPKTSWEKEVIRGIYLSRYYITNNASEKKIRERVRYYRSQGINTIIHGVWGNGCTMYNSKVMQQTLGYKSCPK